MYTEVRGRVAGCIRLVHTRAHRGSLAGGLSMIGWGLLTSPLAVSLPPSSYSYPCRPTLEVPAPCPHRQHVRQLPEYLRHLSSPRGHCISTADQEGHRLHLVPRLRAEVDEGRIGDVADLDPPVRQSDRAGQGWRESVVRRADLYARCESVVVAAAHNF